jgi:hypothetical protein
MNEIPLKSALFALSNDTKFTLWVFLVIELQATKSS